MITTDQNPRYQQNPAERRIGILGLSTHDLRRLQAAAGMIAAAVNAIAEREYRHLGVP